MTRQISQGGEQRSRHLAALCAAALASAASQAQAAGFLDTSIDPAAYQASTYVQGGSIALSATSSGNSGAALLQLFTVPSPALVTDHSYAYLINRAFAYDPALQGAVGSISFSIDKSVTLNPSSVPWGNGQGFLLEQGGRLYQTDTGLSAIQSVFLTAATTVLSPASFYLLVNPATHQTDANAHPDFSAGAMRFGFYNGAGVSPGTPDLQIRYVFDNFGVTVSPVPEPATAALWLLGLSCGAVCRRVAARRQAVAA